MTHNPDIQKEAIMSWQKQCASLASSFDTILRDPYISVEDRRAKLLDWAYKNRYDISEKLKA